MKHHFPVRCKSLTSGMLYVLAIAAYACVFPALAHGQARAPGPRPVTTDGPLVCDEPVFDFGERDSTAAFKHTFSLKNAGDAAITIDRVITTCGCTAATLDKKTLAPGESVPLEIDVRLAGFRGNFQRHTYVVYGGDEPQQTRLTIRGTIVQRIRLTPERLNLALASADSPTTASAVIESLEESAKFRITKLDSQSKYLDVRVDTSEDGMKHTLHIATVPPIPKGAYPTVIQLSTDNPDYPSVNIPVSLRVVGRVQVVPEEVVLYDRGTGGRAESMRFLNIMPGSVQEFTIKGVEVPLPSIETEIIARPGSRYLVKLMNMPVDPELEGKEVVLLTDIPDMERFSVPIRIKEYPTPPAASR